MPEINKDGSTYRSGRPKPTLQLAWYGVEKLVSRLLPKAREMGWKSPSELALALINGWLQDPTPDPDNGPRVEAVKEAKPKPKAAKKEAKLKAPKAVKKEVKPKAKPVKKEAKPKAVQNISAADAAETNEASSPEEQRKLQEARRAKARARL